MMNAIIIILFLIVTVLAFLEDYLTVKQKIVTLLTLGIVMVIVACTKDVEHTADAEAYMHIFYNNDDELTELATEPSYIYLSRLILAFGGPFVLMFIIYACVTIPMKIYALNKLTPYVFTAMVIYIPVYYELHDLVQIRAGAAAACMLFSIGLIVEKKYLPAVCLMIVGFFLHYSSAVYFPLLLMGDKQLNKFWRIFCAIVVPIGFVMYFAHLSLLSFIPSVLMGGKMDYYTYSAEVGIWGDMITPYKNLFLMVKILMLYIFLFYYEKIKDASKYLSIVLVLTTLSIFFYLSMATVPTVATRVSDMYAIIDPILFTFLIYLISPKYIARLCTVVVGVYMLVFNMVTSQYFT